MTERLAGAFRVSAAPFAQARRNQYAVSRRHSFQTKPTLQYMEHAPMLVVPFISLICLGRFPTAKDVAELTVPYDKINRPQSLVVYVSHSPVGPKGKEDLKKRPKYKLIVQAVEHWLKTWAKGLDVYLWIPPVSASTDSQLQSVLSYIERCDCTLIPIVDPDHENWPLIRSHHGLFHDYQAAAFHSHLATAWGRLELIASTRVTRLADTFDVCVLMGSEPNFNGCRPVFLFGTKEALADETPLLLPEVRARDLQTFNPSRGTPSFRGKKDVENAQNLYRSLAALFKEQQTIGYKGGLNDDGLPQGIGMRTYENGDRYNGEWADGSQNGFGTYLYEDGSRYEGEWKDGKRHGKGRFIFWSGNVEECNYIDDLQDGPAVFRRVEGGLSRGNYKEGKRVGMWVRENAEGFEMMRFRYEDGVQVSRE
eukprot:c16373_g1_i1.p1 GENE.c16373_g1_i1~~c16373_g1_i1.p1  ORF type:complete len:471 (+),score=102.24 c16373_g1_i1:147-1415(+)